MKLKVNDTFSSLWLSAILLLGLLPAASIAEVAVTASSAERGFSSGAIQSDFSELVDQAVEKIMVDRQIPGIALTIVQDGKLVKTQGYGWLDRDLNVHVRPSSVFPIASMSKPLTATGIMLLVAGRKTGYRCTD